MMRPCLRGIMLALADRLAHQEDAADVQVHHLVPGLERMVLGRRAPGGAGVVDQDVDRGPGAASPRRQTRLDLRRVAGSRPRSSARRCPRPAGAAAASSRSAALRELSMILRAGLAQRLGHLQAQAARAAGDQRGLAAQVEQFAGSVCSCAVSGVDGTWLSTAARAQPDQHDAGGRPTRAPTTIRRRADAPGCARRTTRPGR